MIHDSLFFNFQEVIAHIREKAAKMPLICQPLLETITDETEFEDLPLYKEYLSLFHVEHDLEEFCLGKHGLRLNVPFEPPNFEADCMPFLRLVAASFWSIYELEYDDETNSVNLIITWDNPWDPGEENITTKFQELSSFQISRLFENYIGEQLNIEAIRQKSKSCESGIVKGREDKLMEYKKKMRQLKNQIEKKGRIREAQKESNDTLSDLDDLLNS